MANAPYKPRTCHVDIGNATQKADVDVAISGLAQEIMDYLMASVEAIPLQMTKAEFKRHLRALQRKISAAKRIVEENYRHVNLKLDNVPVAVTVYDHNENVLGRVTEGEIECTKL